MTPALERGVFNHWTAREVTIVFFFLSTQAIHENIIIRVQTVQKI